MRGIHNVYSLSVLRDMITPAYAGNTVIVNIEFTKNVDLETTIFGELIVI